jgi:NADH-quinone oxidoreductase subunit J
MAAIFFPLAALLLLSAIGVVAFHNPIHSALSLVLHLVGVAMFFALLDAHFLAVTQIIVYAGAIVVLVLFVLMLLNLKVERSSSANIGLLAVGGVSAVGVLWAIVPYLHSIFRVFPDPVTPVVGDARLIGKEIFTKYVFGFEVASILIMAAVVGAVMLAKRRQSDLLKEKR